MKKPKFEMTSVMLIYNENCIDSFAEAVIRFLYKRNENQPIHYIDELETLSAIFADVAKANKEMPINDADFPF